MSSGFFFNHAPDSGHAAPTFIIAKKTGTVRVVSDFRRLNAKISNKNRFPALDLNMGYYEIRLDKEAQNLCTIVFLVPIADESATRILQGIICTHLGDETIRCPIEGCEKFFSNTDMFNSQILATLPFMVFGCWSINSGNIIRKVMISWR